MGYSGHATVVGEAVLANGCNLLGYFDRIKSLINPFEIPFLGFEGDVDLPALVGENVLFPSVGSNSIRMKMIRFLEEAGINQAIVKHPLSFVSEYSSVQASTFLGARSVINPLCEIGRGVIINTGCIIEHGCRIGDFSHIAPGSILTGDVSVGSSSFIGANTVIRQGQKIGNNVIVGAGSVVVTDIGDNEVWFGNPAKRHK